jgi:transcriptional regulator with XRE-family HTH domain
MTSVKEVLAQNLKENRRRLGITQPELACMSTQYLAMIEIARKFPTADILERLAAALSINPHELFSVPVSPERAIEQLQKAILENMERAMEHALDKAIEKRCGDGNLLSESTTKKI